MIALIVAKDTYNGIGIQNQLPWKLSQDLRYFKDLTSRAEPSLKNALIMGKNTWNSLPKKPLPNRLNVILSSQSIENLPDTSVVCSSFESALSFLDTQAIQTTFIIGGSTVFEKAFQLPYLKTLYITQIHHHFTCDCYFPKIPPTFSLVQESPNEENGILFSFQKWINTTL